MSNRSAVAETTQNRLVESSDTCLSPYVDAYFTAIDIAAGRRTGCALIVTTTITTQTLIVRGQPHFPGPKQCAHVEDDPRGL